MRGRFALLRIAGLACLVALVAGCKELRLDCPACKNPDTVLQVGCPYSQSSLNGGDFVAHPDLLILSGGGSHGAWGAGVLAGWTQAGTRPTFAVVTGVSTGALQASYAFVGTQKDPELEQFFTQSKNGDIFKPKLDFIISDGLQSREPLKNLLTANLTDDLLDAVVTESQTGRELMVGTINLDTSQFCPWNLSTIAQKWKAATGDVDKQKCWKGLYRDVVWAASGAPVIAPPVEIDANACTGKPAQRMLYADGGVRLRVFVTDVIDQAVSAVNSANAANAAIPGATPITLKAWVVMNGQLVTHPECVADSLMPIAARTFEIMDREALFGSLYALMYRFGSNVALRLSRIPDNACVTLSSSEFDPPRLKCMFDEGSAWVQNASNWESTIPTVSAAPRPPGCCPTMPKCVTPCIPSAKPCPM